MKGMRFCLLVVLACLGLVSSGQLVLTNEGTNYNTLVDFTNADGNSASSGTNNTGPFDSDFMTFGFDGAATTYGGAAALNFTGIKDPTSDLTEVGFNKFQSNPGTIGEKNFVGLVPRDNGSYYLEFRLRTGNYVMNELELFFQFYRENTSDHETKVQMPQFSEDGSTFIVFEEGSEYSSNGSSGETTSVIHRKKNVYIGKSTIFYVRIPIEVVNIGGSPDNFSDLVAFRGFEFMATQYPMVRFDLVAPDPIVVNDEGNSFFQVTLEAFHPDFSGTVTEAISVDVKIDPSTSEVDASDGLDPASFSQTVSWRVGDAVKKTINIAFTDDGLNETDEVFFLFFEESVGESRLRVLKNADDGREQQQVQILDNDFPEVNFVLANISETEGDGGSFRTVTFDLILTNPYPATDGKTTTVDVAISGAPGSLTATTNVDFRYPASGNPSTVSWAPGETGVKSVTYEIFEDLIIEGDEKFTLDLSAAGTETVTIGPTDAMEVVIEDDDAMEFNFKDNSNAPFPGQSVRIGNESSNTSYVLRVETDRSHQNEDVVFTVLLDTLSTHPDLIEGRDFDVLIGGVVTPSTNGEFTLTIPQGGTTVDMEIQIKDDNLVEYEEFIRWAFDSLPPYGTEGPENSHEIIVNDPEDRSIVRFTTSNVVVSEPASSANFTVVVENPNVNFPTVIDLGAVPGSLAILGTDFDFGGSASLSMGPGTDPGTNGPAATLNSVQSIDAIDDPLVEGEETATIRFDGVSVWADIDVATPNFSVTVNDDDFSTVEFEFSTQSFIESSGGGVIRVVLDKPHVNNSVVVRIDSVGGAGVGLALYTTDYMVPAGGGPIPFDITFPKNTTAITFPFTIVNDGIVEGDEDFFMDIINATQNTSIGANTRQTITIVDDDITQVTFTAASLSLTEPSSTTTYTTQVELTQPHGASDVTFDVVLKAGGSATDGLDFTISPIQTITYPMGTSGTQNVSFDLLADAAVEGTENFYIEIINVSPGSVPVGIQEQEIIILDDEVLEIEFVTQTSTDNESNGVDVFIQARSSAGSINGPTTVDLVTLAGSTASPGTDFVIIDPPSGQLTFDANVPSTKLIQIRIINDALLEGNETVILGFANLTNGATVGSSFPNHTLTIVDDEQTGLEARFQNQTSSQIEGSSGAIYDVLIPVEVSAVPETGSLVVNIAAGASSTATEGGTEDFFLATNSVIFYPGDPLVKDFLVKIDQDTKIEGDETAVLEITSVQWLAPDNSVKQNGGVGSSYPNHTLTILDDDLATAEFNITTQTIAEEDGANNAITITHTVVLDQASAGDIVVRLVPSDIVARKDQDYVWKNAGGTSVNDFLLTIPAGQLFASYSYSETLPDDVVEGDETYEVRLFPMSGPVQVLGNDVQTVTITDNDFGTFSIVRNDVDNGGTAHDEQIENKEGYSNSFKVIFDKVIENVNVSVDVMGTGGSANQGSDYDLINSTLNFAPGQSEALVVVNYAMDGLVENLEGWQVTILNPSTGNSIDGAQNSLNYSIINEDFSTVQFTLSNDQVNESAGNHIITVTIDKAHESLPTRVQVADIGGGLATAGVDYNFSTPTTVTFPAGNNGAQTVSVIISNDAVVEGSELTSFELQDMVPNASFSAQYVLGTIVNHQLEILDDDVQTLTITSVANIAEDDGAASPTATTFAVTINADKVHENSDVDVNVLIVEDDLAVFGNDFSWALAAGKLASITIPKNTTSVNFNISTIADKIVEGPESFTLELQNPTMGSVLGNPFSAATQIVDNDDIEVNILPIPDGPEGSSVTARVQLDPTVTVENLTLAVDIQGVLAPVGNPDAVAGSDYTFNNQTVTFPVGTQFVDLNIPLTADGTVEPDEYASLQISNPQDPSYVKLGVNTNREFIIQDQDSSVVNFATGTTTITEGDGGLQTLTVNVSLDQAPAKGPVVVQIVYANGLATVTNDFTQTTTSVTFNNGEFGPKPVVFQVVGDLVVEGDEDFDILFGTITGPAKKGVIDQVDVTISDDDQLEFEIANGANTDVNEGSSESLQIRWLDDVERGTVTFDLAELGTATAQFSNDAAPDLNEPDFKAYSYDVAGKTAGQIESIPLTYIEDFLHEGDEPFAWVIQNVTGANVTANSSFNRVIKDNDFSIFSFDVLSATVVEDVVTYNLLVNVDKVNENYPISVDLVDLFSGSATYSSDYTWVTPQTLTFAPGDPIQKTIAISVTDDALNELAETVQIQLQNPAGTGNSDVRINTARDDFELTITDNDIPEVNFQTATRTFNENAGGVGVTLTIDRAPVTDIVVEFTILELGSINQMPASQDVSFPNPLEVTFPAGLTAPVDFNFTILEDILVEGTENFRILASIQSGNATINQDQMDIDILDNDVAVVSFDPAAAPAIRDESDGTMDFKLTLSNPLEHQNVVVTLSQTAGDVTMGSDLTYPGFPGAMKYTFIPGASLNGTFTFNINDDGLLEGDEDLTVDIAVSPNASLGAITSRAKTLTDNEQAEVFISNYGTGKDVVEGNSIFLAIETSLAHSNEDITVDVIVIPPSQAVNTVDFTLSAATVTIPQGSLGPIIVTLDAIDDVDIEGNEDYYLRLSNVQTPRGDVVLDDNDDDDGDLTPDLRIAFEGTIIDNDIPTVEIVNATMTVNEGDGSILIEATLDRPHQTQTVTAQFSAITFANQANTPADFQVPVPFELKWDPGQSGSKFLTLGLTDDGIIEDDEFFDVRLDNVLNGVPGSGRLIRVNIEDNDESTVRFLSAFTTVDEDAGTVTVSVELDKLHEDQETEVWVNLDGSYVAPDIAANSTADFDGSIFPYKIMFPKSGTGSNIQTFDITIIDDSFVEGPEQFGLVIDFTSAWVNVPSAPRSAIEITDKGERTSLQFSSISDVHNEDVGSYTVDIEITNPNVNFPTTVDLVLGTSVSGPNATPVSDYQFNGLGTVTFPAGSTTPFTMVVDVVDDGLAEADEYALAEIQNPSPWADLINTEHELKIIDNENALVQFNPVVGTANESGGSFSLSVNLSQPTTAGVVTVDVNLMAGYYSFAEAKEGAFEDFELVAPNTSVTWNPGEFGDKTITLPIGQDVFVEGDEFFMLRLQNVLVDGNPSTAINLGARDTAEVIIEDDDRTIVDFVAGSSNQTEGTLTGTTQIELKGVNVNYPTEISMLYNGGVAQNGGIDFDFTSPITVNPISEADYNGTDEDVVVNFNWTLVDDAIVEGLEVHELELGSTDYWFQLGTLFPNHDFEISDNDVSNLHFAFDEYSVNEDDGSLQVQVVIDAPNVNAATTVEANVFIDGGINEAINGNDYTFSNPTIVTFPANDGTPQNINIPINDDLLSEGEEYFKLQLSNGTPVTTASIDPVLGRTTVNIVDNDVPMVSFRDITLSETEDNNPGSYSYLVTLDVTNPPTTPLAETTVEVELLNGISGVSATYPADIKLGNVGDPDNNKLTLNVLMNVTQITFRVTHKEDALVEGAETFRLTLNSPNNDLVFGNRNSDGVIEDNDRSTVQFVSISGNVPENGGTAFVTVELDLLNANLPTTVDVQELVGGLAVFNTDYTFNSASPVITFPSGAGVSTGPVTRNITITGINDGFWEELEDFQLELVNPSAWADISGTNGTITGQVMDDEVPQVNFITNNYVHSESDPSINVDVELTIPNENNPVDVTVKFAATTDPFKSPLSPAADYAVSPDGGGGFEEVITFAPGQTAQTIALPVLQDTDIEGPEYGDATIVADPRFTSSLPTSELILNDDDIAIVRFVEVNESEMEGNSIDLSVELDRPIAADSKLEIFVDMVLDPQSLGQEGVDFTGANSLPINYKFTAADNPPTKTETWNLVDDAIVEGTEPVVFKLENVTAGATIGTLDSLILNIEDNDQSEVEFRLASSTASEENPGVTHFVEAVIRNPNVNQPTTADVVVSGGTAIAGTDYNFGVQTFTWPANASGNDTLQSVLLTVVNDNIPEGIETVNLDMQNFLPTGSATFVPGGNIQHVVNIADTDQSDVFFLVDSLGVNEQVITYQVSVGIANPNVNYPTTVDIIDVDGLALDGSDYLFGNTPKTVTFPANTTLPQTFTVDIIEDTDVEGWHDLDFNLSNTIPTQFINFTNPDVKLYIFDNDSAQVSFVTSSQNVLETAGSSTIQVQITNPTLHHPTQVDLVLQGTGTATVGADFTYPMTQTVTFPAGDNTTQSITVPIAMDGLVEGSEDFILELQNPSQLVNFDPNTLDTITILDQDSSVVYFTDSFLSVEEGDIIRIQVGLVGSHVVDTTYTTLRYIPNTASEPEDLTMPFDTTIAWYPGDESSRFVNVSTIDDIMVEGDEYGAFVFINNSSSVSNNSTDSLQIEIRDNDRTTVRFRLDTYTVDETAGDTVVEVEIFNPHTLYATTVDVKRIGGTATEIFDFTATDDTTLTFAANSTAPQFVPVSIFDDILTEGRENIVFELSNASAWVQLENPIHDLVIRDNEVAELVMVEASSSIGEDGVTATFEVEVASAPSIALQPVTVDVVWRSGSAVLGSDFEFTTTSLTFPPGAVGTQEVSVTINEDAYIEGDETMIFRLENPSNNAEIDPARMDHEITIIDNDFTTLSFTNTLYSVNETGGFVDVAVSITNPHPTNATSVDVVLLGGTATQGVDYVYGAPVTLTFPAASSAPQTVQIPILDDADLEPLEYFNLQLQNNSANSAIGVGTTKVNIIDDEVTEVRFVNGSQSVMETVGFTSMFVEVVSPNPTQGVEVTVAFDGGTATLNEDFGFGQTIVVFGPGETGPKEVAVNIYDDAEQEGAEVANFKLQSPEGAVITSGQHSITIMDDEVPQVYFVQDSIQVYENSSSGNLLVAIENPYPDQDITVDVLFDGGTATLGVDVDFTPFTLTFPMGSVAPQMVPIQILDDLLEEDEEYFELRLSNISGGASIARPVIKVKIRDDDGANAPIPLPEYTIAEIHGENAVGGADSLNTRCFLTGIVHGVNLSSNGLDFFIHDNTGGINVFKGLGNLGYVVNEGDEIKVRGIVRQSNGLTRFEADAIVLLSTANILQTPIVTDNIGEPFESHLVELQCVELSNGAEWTNLGNSFLVEVNKNGVTNHLLIDANTSVYGSVPPFGSFTVKGIVAQLDGTNPYLNNYYIIPMSISDVDASLDGPFTYVQVNKTFSFSLGGNSAVSVEWDFGDGFGVSNQFTPGYTYFQYGTYTVTVTTTDANGCTYTQTQEVKIVDPNSVSEITSVDYTLFPNPVKDHLFLDVKKDVDYIEIYDASGRLIHRTLGENGNEHYRIDLAVYSEGVYQVVILLDNGDLIREKVIKRD